MKAAPMIFLVLLVAGCTTEVRREPTAAAVVGEGPSRTNNPSSHPAPARTPRPKSDPLKLAAYEVKESAFSDFGMSVKTNFEVKWGGHIEWMTVSAVATPSSASRMGLAAGDRIMAIDGRLVTEMDRDAMLEKLFQRKKGETSRILVIGPQDPLPRFVMLVAHRPDP